ncbi:MAG: DNA polymerase III subunit epsilon [Gammaproteobacteria bacterium]
MRRVVLDTETTGLNAQAGHRIIEVGCVELDDRAYTGRTLHRYINPEREIEAGAQDVHGITNEQLAGAPLFAEVAEELREFITGAELIIHNAPFDVGFLDAEYKRLNPAHVTVNEWAKVLDTLLFARETYPGQANSLDALCRRLSVDNSGREYHGALLDAQLLAEVYLSMTGGQVTLGLEARSKAEKELERKRTHVRQGPLPVVVVSAEERAAHRARMEVIREAAGVCLWDRIATN